MMLFVLFYVIICISLINCFYIDILCVALFILNCFEDDISFKDKNLYLGEIYNFF